MKEFYEKHKNTLFRYWLRKRMWTPYDMERKYPDQLEYGDKECSYGYIVEVIDLSYDWLIGISDEPNGEYIEYHKFNDLELAYCKTDQEAE